jgi:hypothetical protein
VIHLGNLAVVGEDRVGNCPLYTSNSEGNDISEFAKLSVVRSRSTVAATLAVAAD